MAWRNKETYKKWNRWKRKKKREEKKKMDNKILEKLLQARIEIIADGSSTLAFKCNGVLYSENGTVLKRGIEKDGNTYFIGNTLGEMRFIGVMTENDMTMQGYLMDSKGGLIDKSVVSSDIIEFIVNNKIRFGIRIDDKVYFSREERYEFMLEDDICEATNRYENEIIYIAYTKGSQLFAFGAITPEIRYGSLEVVTKMPITFDKDLLEMGFSKYKENDLNILTANTMSAKGLRVVESNVRSNALQANSDEMEEFIEASEDINNDIMTLGQHYRYENGNIVVSWRIAKSKVDNNELKLENLGQIELEIYEDQSMDMRFIGKGI